MLCHATGDTIPGLTLRTTRVIVVRPKDPGQGVNVNTIQIWALVILVLLQQTRSAACDINSTTVTSSKNKFRLAHVQSNVLSTAFLLSDLCHLALGAHKVTPAVKSPQAKAVSSTGISVEDLPRLEQSPPQEPPEASVLTLPSRFPRGGGIKLSETKVVAPLVKSYAQLTIK